jgi:mannitol-specific phosphotransferase system IIBC component
VSTALGRLEAARAELESFRQENEKVIEQYQKLCAERAEAYDEMKSLYARHSSTIGSSYAGFSMVKKRSVDAELLVELMPDAITIVKHTLAVARLDELVRAGAIDQDIAEQVTCVNEVINGPKL